MSASADYVYGIGGVPAEHNTYGRGASSQKHGKVVATTRQKTKTTVRKALGSKYGTRKK